MAAEIIGPAKCPLCGGTARVSLSKSQLCVMVMNCCNAQLFTRSDRSDSLVRALLLPKDVPETKPDTPPDPAAEATVTEPAAADPVTTETEPKKRSPFSLLGYPDD